MIYIPEKGEQNNIDDSKKSEDVPGLLNIIQNASTELCGLVDGLKEQMKTRKLDTSDGISLLEVKNQMMLSYLINTVFVIAKKCNGKSIEGDTAIERLVEIRTALERIRPLEHKLKYMMEKMVKVALTGVTNETDPIHFRANPENMVDNVEGSASESEEDGAAAVKQVGKTQVYVPPRLAPVHYDEEENASTRKQKQVERARKRALHSSVVEELKEQYLNTPAEVSHGNTLKAFISKHQKQKTQYEEEYFTRLPTSKKEKHRSRLSMTVGNIGTQVTHFENIQVLEDEGVTTGHKRRRRPAGRPSKKKSFKKRKAH